MKRERQWDMFDVATGACELDDYLNQRYSEGDIQSKFWVEPNDEMDELRPPPKGSKEQILIPIQGPKVTPPQPAAPVPTEPLPSRPPWETAAAPEPMPSRPSWEAAPAEPKAQPSVAVPQPAPAPYTPPERPAVSPTSPPPPTPVASSPPWSPPAAPATPAEPIQAAQSEPVQAPEPPAAPSMEELLARFHQAAKAYEERSKDDLDDVEQPPEN